MKIIALSDSNFSTMETIDIFNELKAGDGVPVSHFLNMYQQVTNKIPVASDEKKAQQNKTMNNNSTTETK